MAVKFLTDEWAQQVTERLNTSEVFKQAAAGARDYLTEVAWRIRV